ncbi:hypothetical protein Lal_00037543 [Lupinus albus]|nr:hypothetical protein Lal_00037543 [Lupinus albus]
MVSELFSAANKMTPFRAHGGPDRMELLFLFGFDDLVASMAARLSYVSYFQTSTPGVTSDAIGQEGGCSVLLLRGIQRLHSFAPGSKICALCPSPLLLPLSTLRVVILPLTTEDNFSTSNPRLLGLLVQLWHQPCYQSLFHLDDDSTTSTSVEEETAKTCLMVKDNEVVTSSMVDKLDEVSSHESSSCTSSTNLPTYDEPYNAFVEMHEELNKVAKINVDRKRIILLHEKKIASMQKELDELKLEN